MLEVNVVTLFPETMAPFLAASIPGRAATAGKVTYRLVQLRDFAHLERNRNAGVLGQVGLALLRDADDHCFSKPPKSYA